jgi:hypothetical protein
MPFNLQFIQLDSTPSSRHNLVLHSKRLERLKNEEKYYKYNAGPYIENFFQTEVFLFSSEVQCALLVITCKTLGLRLRTGDKGMSFMCLNVPHNSKLTQCYNHFKRLAQYWILYQELHDVYKLSEVMQADWLCGEVSLYTVTRESMLYTGCI